MKRGKALVVIAMGLALALGALLITTQAATADRRGARGNSERADRLPSRCSYPPVTTPSLTLVAFQPTVRGREQFTLGGSLKVNTCGLKNISIGIFASPTATGTFSFVGSAKTDGNGSYTVKLRQSGTRFYQATSAPTDSYNAAASGVVTVTTVP
jgi:hypothetical protein